MNAFATFSSQKNRESSYEKPNEDFLIADNEHLIFIVADGVTRELVDGKYLLPSPAGIASKLFATVTHNELIKNKKTAPAETLLRDAAAKANTAIHDYNKSNFEHIDFFENNLAGAVSLVGIIANSEFHFIYLGDCRGIYIKDGIARQFTESQTALMSINRKSLGSGKEQKIHIRRDICNNIDHPYGYGVFTGAVEAMSFLRYGRITLTGHETIVMATDGLDPLFPDHFNPEDKLDPFNLIEKAEALETSNNTIRSDDKTVIIIKVSDNPS